MTKVHVPSRLDRVLTAIEDGILEASDEEILAEENDVRGAAQGIRSLVRAAVKRSRRTAPRGSRLRLELLRELLDAQPSLSPALSMRFSAGATPSEREIDDAIEDLLRRGVLDDDKN